MLCFALADRLKRPVFEIMSLPLDTVYEWAAYCALVEEEKGPK